MSNAIAINQISSKIEQVLVQGDLASLNPEERLQYYNAVCASLGLNPLTKPFDYMSLNGKLILYARRECTEQLRKIHSVSIQITAREKIGDVYVVTARAKLPSGREDESTGAVALGKLSGDALANAYLKAETKAKRRATLSICGLGLLDETEVDSVPGVADASKAEKLNQREIKVVSDEKASDDKAKIEPGDFVIEIGQKARGKRLKDVAVTDLEKMIEYVDAMPKPSDGHLLFKEKATEYLLISGATI